jgi:hypothetical protein
LQHKVHLDVLPQLEALDLDPNRPIIISDADEVIFAFVEGLESYLNANKMYLDLKSFALTGNIRWQENREAVEAVEVRDAIQGFFAERTASMPLIPGAIEALNKIKKIAQVVVLTNIPLLQRQARADALLGHGLDVPVVANIGLKGPAVDYIMSRTAAPAIFIDDIPHNLDSVRDCAADAIRLHFIGDLRLAKLLGPAESANARIDEWTGASDYIHRCISNKTAVSWP